MTYAGLKSMIYCGVGPDDPRVQAATKWIRQHYTIAENPGMGADGLFYYYHTFAKALDAVGEDEFVDASGRRKLKGNMDIELAIDAMELSEHIDQMVLFSGDGDFRSLVEAVQRRGVQVTVISTVSTQPAMIADELRRQADVFTDLIELRPLITRELPTRSSDLSHPHFAVHRGAEGKIVSSP
jgi:hypothetical protein